MRRSVPQTTEAIIDQIVNLPPQTRILILAPIVRGRRGEYREHLEDALKAGFVRARIDGQIYNLPAEIQLDRNQRHNIEIVVDRIVVKPDIRSRVAEAVETALRMGRGSPDCEASLKASRRQEISYSGWIIPVCAAISAMNRPAPRNFSFNSPRGDVPNL